MPPNYQQGKIYAIRSHQTEEIYIGSTTQSLCRRLAKHKQPTNTSNSREILKYPDAYIELIEEYPCNSKEELNKKEGEHIRANNCVNKQIAGRTYKEWVEDNHDKIAEYREANKNKLSEYKKDYDKINKEQIKEYQKQYYDTNKNKILEYYQANKEQIKEYQRQYREAHKNKALEYQRQYREAHKNKIAEKQSS